LRELPREPIAAVFLWTQVWFSIDDGTYDPNDVGG